MRMLISTDFHADKIQMQGGAQAGRNMERVTHKFNHSAGKTYYRT